MKKKIEKKINLSFIHYNIEDEDLKKELIASYFDQYDELIEKNFSEKEAYKKIIKSLDDLSAFNTSELAISKNTKKNFICLYFIIHLTLISFYLFTWSVNLVKIELGIIFYIIIGFFTTLPFLISDLIKDKGNQKKHIKWYLILLLMYVPILVHELSPGVANNYLLSVLSYYTLMVALGLGLNLVFTRKLSLLAISMLVLNLALFLTRFLYDYPLVSFVILLVSFLLFFTIIVIQLWDKTFKRIENKKLLLIFLTGYAVGSIINIIFSLSTINIGNYKVLMLGIIVISLGLFTKIFKSIKYLRYLYWGSLAYMLFSSFKQLINLVYFSFINNFIEGTVNFYSVQLSILTLVLFITTFFLQLKPMKKGEDNQ